MTVIFDGREEAENIKNILIEKAQGLSAKLGIILVGEGEASHIYVNRKMDLARALGVATELKELEEFDLDEVLDQIEDWNTDPIVTGIMVQLPIEDATPEQTEQILKSIALDKDVDGLNPNNVAKIATGEQTFLPATVAAVEHIVNLSKVEKNICGVVGSKGAVGRALAARLRFLGWKVSEFDKGDDLAGLSECELVISCTGKRRLITSEFVGTGATVIDVGFPSGDVDFDEVKDKARFITPVPGGVGPLTVVMLFENLLSVKK